MTGTRRKAVVAHETAARPELTSRCGNGEPTVGRPTGVCTSPGLAQRRVG